MSDEQGPGELVDDNRAFEYASGLMRGVERAQFEAQLAVDPALQSAVHSWEEQLEYLQDRRPLEPRPDTWAAIEEQIAPSRSNAGLKGWMWALAGATVMAMVMLIVPQQALIQDVNDEQGTTSVASSVDYVAVMTTDEQQPGLTTFGYAQEKTLQLHWQLTAQNSADEDYQLWAKSKRDGQIRSIAIIEDTSVRHLQLNEATWRLVTDAQSLLLTIEESGGSAIDEPSDVLIASGVCVRIEPGDQPG